MKIYRLTALPNGFSKLARAAFNTLDGYLYLVGTKVVMTDEADDLEVPRASLTHSRSSRTGSFPGLPTGWPKARTARWWKLSKSNCRFPSDESWAAPSRNRREAVTGSKPEI